MTAERARAGHSPGGSSAETPLERRRRLLDEVTEDFKRREIGLDMAENLPRSELYDRDRARAETERERRKRILDEVIEDIRRTSPGFSAADNLPREAIYDRDRARAEAKAAAEKEGQPPAESSGET